MVRPTPAGDAALSPLLLESLNALADAGQVDLACRIAGRACMQLRKTDETEARRFDVWLHRMIKRLDWDEPPG